MTKVKDFLGPYRLTRLIRMGSTCQVWEAVESESGDHYALKVLRPDFRDSKSEIGFLKNEFEVAQKFNHPNVIRIKELVLNSETPFLVIELFSELNLKQAMRRGPDSIAYMLDKIAQQSIEGLYHIHSQGILHCDIKPDNFLVSRDGEVKVIDFTISQKIRTGLGKLFGGKSKVIQGTRSYMAPEQIRGQRLDPRSDIYAFGCVLFETVTGKPPFTGSSPNELLQKHLSAPIPSPLVANDNVTNEFSNLIRTMMAKKPDDRPPTMWELLKTLRATKIFRKQPRIPEESIFDDFPTSGRLLSQEQAERS